MFNGRDIGEMDRPQSFMDSATIVDDSIFLHSVADETKALRPPGLTIRPLIPPAPQARRGQYTIVARNIDPSQQPLLRTHFQHFGPVKRLRVIDDVGFSTIRVFVDYDTRTACDRAIRAMDGKKMGPTTVYAGYAAPLKK